MKNYKYYSVITVVVVSMLSASNLYASVRVVATTSNLAAIAKEVVGPRGSVETLSTGTRDPHTIPPKPSYMLKMNKADLLIFQGLELEIGWLPKLLVGARNPEILPGKLGNLDASQAITNLLGVPSSPDLMSRAMGDVHPFGNPHYTVDPRNGIYLAKLFAERLGELDPDNKEAYEAAADNFITRLNEHIARWEQQAKNLKGIPVIEYHKEWEYMMAWLGLNIVDTVEVKPGIPPTPGHLVILDETIKAQKVRLIINSPWHPRKAMDRLAERTGIRAAVLPIAVGSTEEATDYFALFDSAIALLVEGSQ